MSYQSKSIRDIINGLNDRIFILPEFQRDFVWKDDQITALFVSLISGYPIGTFIFWKVKRDYINSQNLNVYEFLRDFSEYEDKKYSPQIHLPIQSLHDDYFVVLDGQQRITSLLIGLQGSSSRIAANKRKKLVRNYVSRQLYLDLSFPLEGKMGDNGLTQDGHFLFLSEQDEKLPSYFLVAKILDFHDDAEVYGYCQKNGLDATALSNLASLFHAINDKEGNGSITYFEIEKDDVNRAIDIFVKVNSSGTPLSKASLLLTQITEKWPKAKKEINSLLVNLNRLGDGFAFSSEFMIRACLALTDSPVSLKIGAFKDGNILPIRDNWHKINQAFMTLGCFLAKYGFSRDNITSYNALMPIAYYLYRGGESSSANEKEFRRYLAVALITRAFGGTSDTTITEFRRVLQNIDCVKTPFNLSLFVGTPIGQGRNFGIDDSYIEACFHEKKGPQTLMVLSLIYPEIDVTKMQFHQDHLHPFTAFDDKKIKKLGLDAETVKRWQKERNYLPNLQLLPSPDNESKNDRSLIDYLSSLQSSGQPFPKFWPVGISYELKDFDVFQQQRKALMFEAIKKVLTA